MFLILDLMDMDKKKKLILWFNEINMKDVGLVGGKNASLGEMYRSLASRGINVPNGFAITAYAFRQFLKFNYLEKKIKDLIQSVDAQDVRSLEETGTQIRNLILKAKLFEELREAIERAYRKLIGKGATDVAVRSSATAEDLPLASFAGQLESFLNVRGSEILLETVKK